MYKLRLTMGLFFLLPTANGNPKKKKSSSQSQSQARHVQIQNDMRAHGATALQSKIIRFFVDNCFDIKCIHFSDFAVYTGTWIKWAQALTQTQTYCAVHVCVSVCAYKSVNESKNWLADSVNTASTTAIVLRHAPQFTKSIMKSAFSVSYGKLFIN